MNKKNSIRKMKSSLRQAGVEQKEFRSDSLVLRELRGASLLRLRSLLEKPAINLVLPGKTGRVQSGDPAVLCLGPREWLFISSSGGSDTLLERVQSAVDPALNSVYDCSSGLAVFRLSGPGAPWLLNKLSGLDYQSGIGSGPHCARTRMAHAAVTVHYCEAGPETFEFELIFDRSLAKYLWELLIASTPHADELSAAFGEAA